MKYTLLARNYPFGAISHHATAGAEIGEVTEWVRSARQSAAERGDSIDLWAVPIPTVAKKATATAQQRINEIFVNPSTSYWLKDALLAATSRDIADALNDAEHLVSLLNALEADLAGCQY